MNLRNYVIGTLASLVISCSNDPTPGVVISQGQGFYRGGDVTQVDSYQPDSSFVDAKSSIDIEIGTICTEVDEYLQVETPPGLTQTEMECEYALDDFLNTVCVARFISGLDRVLVASFKTDDPNNFSYLKDQIIVELSKSQGSAVYLSNGQDTLVVVGQVGLFEQDYVSVLVDKIRDNCAGLEIIKKQDCNLTPFYKDNDKDGIGDSNEEVLGCGEVTGYVSKDGDCDDDNPDVNPLVKEVKDDKDNNCDGQVDEGFVSDTELEHLKDDDAILGDPNAKVSIVEFGGYEDPFSGQFYLETLPILKELYIDNGKVNFIFRDFPLSFHPNAQKAAEAAECAGEQGKYFAMHDKLFLEGVQGGLQTLVDYAEELNLNIDAYTACLFTGAMEAEVKYDFMEGQKLGVTSTPFFFINGVEISGAQPFEVFETEIEKNLD